MKKKKKELKGLNPKQKREVIQLIGAAQHSFVNQRADVDRRMISGMAVQLNRDYRTDMVS